MSTKRSEVAAASLPAEPTPASPVPAKKPRLWTRDFAFLWQGQLVSALGDVVYEIALGFWVLAVTGSTTLMGTIMAAAMIPRVVLGPFAGVWVDRTDRKRIMIVTDVLRGVAVVAVGAAAVFHLLQVWMVLAAGILIGTGGAFFTPAVGSALPDIVNRERLVQANSFYQMIQAGSGIVGNGIGGVLYAVLGAPVMFLANGISYIFSAITLGPVRVPKTHQHPAARKTTYRTDLRLGFRFIWSNRGLRLLLVLSAVLNFFAMIGIVLMLPMFQRTPGLGPAAYGVALASFTFGNLAGMATLAGAKIAPNLRARYFILGCFLFSIPLVLFPFFHVLAVLAVVAVFGGFFNAVVNVLLMSVMQLTVPAMMRGKVMGLMGSISGGLAPIGMAAGGILGDLLPVRLVISGAFAVVALVCIPIALSRDVREFFAQEGEIGGIAPDIVPPTTESGAAAESGSAPT